MAATVLYLGPEQEAKRRLVQMASDLKGGVLPLWINLYKVVPNATT